MRRRSFIASSIALTGGCLRLQSNSDNPSGETSNKIELSEQWELDHTGPIVGNKGDFYLFPNSGSLDVTRVDTEGNILFKKDALLNQEEFINAWAWRKPIYTDTTGIFIGIKRGDSNGRLVKLDQNTGQLLWSHNVEYAPVKITRWEDLILYACVNYRESDTLIQAINNTTGEKQWQIPIPNGITTEIFTEDKLIVYANNRVQKYNITTQNLVWDFELDNTELQSSELHNGVLFLPSSPPKSLDIGSEEEVWTASQNIATATGPCIGDTEAYWGANGGYIHALNRKTGKQTWEIRVDGAIKEPIQYHNGLIWAKTDTSVLGILGSSGEIWYNEKIKESLGRIDLAIQDNILVDSYRGVGYEIPTEINPL